MSGRAWLTDAQAREIGRAVWIGRLARVPWKTLERVYGRGRVQLWRLARGWNETQNPRNETHLGLRNGGAPAVEAIRTQLLGAMTP